MPCDIKRDAEGRMTAIVCSRGPRPRKCAYCPHQSTRLCDHELRRGTGVTCDMPMCECEGCTYRPAGSEKDFCRTHRPAIATAGA